jgi:hypothetical protein
MKRLQGGEALNWRITPMPKARHPHTRHTDEGEVRDIPFLGNDMKDHSATMDKPLDTADAPGKADSEIADEDAPTGASGQG